MMEWYKILSYFFTNEIRIILGIFLVAELMKFSLHKKHIFISLLLGILVTTLNTLYLPMFHLVAIEIIIFIIIMRYLFGDKGRMCLFLIFFYEIGVGLWEFLISSGMGILFQSDDFINRRTIEYMSSIWVVRLLMISVSMYMMKRLRTTGKKSVSFASAIAILGLLGVIVLSGQSVIPVSGDEITSWVILSIVFASSILIFNLNRQYEMEKEIVRLKIEQGELLERDYQALSKIYATNAKLYHDIHNHVEVIYYCIKQGKADDATKYLEDLRKPIREISERIWTGDKAVDFLISSKIALAKQANIQTKINVEFPKNTNIRSVDMVTILGNLLDNALEAVEMASEDLRYINLIIRRINNMIIIKVENGCKALPVLKNGNLQTSKLDKSLHGWGLKSTIAAVERYDGIIDTSCEHYVFRAVATLSYHSVK